MEQLKDIRLPITVIFLVIAQAGGLIWYSATQAATVKRLETEVNKLIDKNVNTQLVSLSKDIESLQRSVTILADNVGDNQDPRVDIVQREIVELSRRLDTHWDEINRSPTFNHLDELKEEFNDEIEDLDDDIDAIYDILVRYRNEIEQLRTAAPNNNIATP